jgi:hypothetical protein
MQLDRRVRIEREETYRGSRRLVGSSARGYLVSADTEQGSDLSLHPLLFRVHVEL